MKIAFLLSFIVLNSSIFQYTKAQNASIGNYPATTIATAGAGISVLASAAPVNAGKLVATTSVNFKGNLVIEQSTGRLNISNAFPAGVYIITVRSVSIPGLDKVFTLTVGNPLCSNASFSGHYNRGTLSGLGSYQSDILATDLDNDKRLDVILGRYNRSGLDYILWTDMLRNQQADILDTIAGPSALAVGDFDKNGSQDIISVSPSTNTASILFSRRPSPFFTYYDSTVRLPVSTNPTDVLVGDFNKDGNPDFATAGATAISVRLGNTTSGFTTAPDVLIPGGSRKMRVDDFNNDENPDLVVLNESANTVSIKLGDGTGAFSNGVTLPIAYDCRTITTADLNNDGYTDLITGSVGGRRANVFLGTGTGGFTAAPDLSFGQGPYDIAAGDFNGDGNIDLVFATASIYVCIRLGNGTGSFIAAPDEVLTGIYPKSVEVTDFDSDGRQDLILYNYFDGKIYIKYGLGGDINLQGNSYNLPNGSNNPTALNFTSFGAVNVGSSLTRSYTIQNTGNYNIVVDDIFLTGADSAQFSRSGITLPATIGANSSISFSMKFTPASLGVKKAWVNITSNDCDETLYNFGIRGGPDTAAALHFDGVNDYISVNDTLGNIGTSDLTFSAWVQAASNTAMSIMNKGSNCTAGSFMAVGLMSNGRLEVRFGENTSNMQAITGKTLVGNNVWHHVAVVRKSDTISLYVDGVKDTATAFGAIAAINNAVPLLLGASNCGGVSSFFSGRMDEVRFYNRALPISEIQTYLSCELVGTQSGLLAYYRLNQGYAVYNNAGITTLTDSSGKGNNGTLNNFALTSTTSNWVAQGSVISGTTCTGRSTWLGLTSSWSDPSNWSNGFVPSEFTQVIINAGITTPIITSPNSICYSLTLNNGATVRVQTGGNLTVLH